MTRPESYYVITCYTAPEAKSLNLRWIKDGCWGVRTTIQVGVSLASSAAGDGFWMEVHFEGVSGINRWSGSVDGVWQM